MSKISCPNVASQPSIPFLSYDLYFSLDHICPLGPSHKAFTFLFHESQNRTWSCQVCVVVSVSGLELSCVMPGRSSESEMKYKGDLDDYLSLLPFPCQQLELCYQPCTPRKDKEGRQGSCRRCTGGTFRYRCQTVKGASVLQQSQVWTASDT